MRKEGKIHRKRGKKTQNGFCYAATLGKPAASPEPIRPEKVRVMREKEKEK